MLFDSITMKISDHSKQVLVKISIKKSKQPLLRGGKIMPEEIQVKMEKYILKRY